MSTIYDLDQEYDDDIINVKKLLGALDRNIDEDNAPVLAEIVGFDLSQLYRAIRSLNHIDVIKW